MRSCKNKAVFFEQLGLFNYLKCLALGYSVYYLKESLWLRKIKAILWGGSSYKALTISYGSLLKVPDVRRNAYELAIKKISEIEPRKWGLNLLQSVNINNSLIIDKWLLQNLFEKYEFYGLIKQYAKENVSTQVKVGVDPLFFDSDVFNGLGIGFSRLFMFKKTKFLISIARMIICYLKLVLKNDNRVDGILSNTVMCEVDSDVVIAMYKDLFGEYENLTFITHGAANQKKIFNHADIKLHEYSYRDSLLLNEIAVNALFFLIKNLNKYFSYGGIFFEIVREYYAGVFLTPNIDDSAYLTFEHLTIANAIRNEILRARGNKSIFVPYNVYTSSPFYAPEYRLNYDVLCSPGSLCEQAYVMQKAETKIVLPTGSYHANKRVLGDEESERRVQTLLSYKGSALAVTILCNGIEDVTYSGEVRLMKLALKLAGQNNIKVIIRQKPVTPKGQYLNFYRDMIGDTDSILLTHLEYKLYDFLPVTDLFITSNSSSILEFCSSGSDFFSVNFWDRTDLFLWQTAVPGVYLDEDTAFEKILAWLNDYPQGTRAEHKRRMDQLSELLAYKFDDYDAYKRNLNLLLKPLFPAHTLAS